MRCVETLVLVIHPYSPCASSKQRGKKNISPVYKISSQWRISVGAFYRPEKSLLHYFTVCRKHPIFCFVISIDILGSQGLNEASLHSLVKFPRSRRQSSVVSRLAPRGCVPFPPKFFSLCFSLLKLDNEETNCSRSV